MTTITRRAALGGLATLSAITLPAASAPPASPLAELIADWRWLEAEWSTAAEAADEILERAGLALERVQYANMVRMEDDGSTTRHPMWVWSHSEIDEWCDCDAAIPIIEMRATVEHRRRRLHVELDAIEAANAARSAELGLDKAIARRDDIGAQERAALNAVLAYRPGTLAEFMERDAFVREFLLSAETVLTEEQQDLVFGVSKAG